MSIYVCGESSEAGGSCSKPFSAQNWIQVLCKSNTLNHLSSSCTSISWGKYFITLWKPGIFSGQNLPQIVSSTIHPNPWSRMLVQPIRCSSRRLCLPRKGEKRRQETGQDVSQGDGDSNSILKKLDHVVMSHSGQPQRSLDFCMFLKFHPYGHPCPHPTIFPLWCPTSVTLSCVSHPVISVALNQDPDGSRKEKLPHKTAKEQFGTDICVQANACMVTGVGIPYSIRNHTLQSGGSRNIWKWYLYLKRTQIHYS